MTTELIKQLFKEKYVKIVYTTNIMHPLLQKVDIDSCENKDILFDKIRNLGLLTKKYGDLFIIKYPKELKYSSDDYIRRSRGIVLDTVSKKIINYSIEGSLDEETFFSKVSWDNIVIEKCMDGTLINLFYHNNTWNISTKFCINADHSKFRSEKSFKQLFQEVVNIDDLELDPKFSYSFLLRHDDNRIVSPVEENKVYYLESVNVITGEKVFINTGLESMNVLRIHNICNEINVNNRRELHEYIDNLNWDIPGLMLFSQDRKYRCKITNPKYQYVESLLANNVDVYMLCLNDLMKEPHKLNEILKYYPEYSDVVENVKRDFNEYIRVLHAYYLCCKVQPKREYIELPKPYRKALVDIHKKFKEERTQGNYAYKMTFEEIVKVLKNYDVSRMHYLLKQVKSEC
jgi:hypothetical protein